MTTEDGYILSIHRIPGGPKSTVARGKSPVLLIHGLLAASDIWVLRGSQHDLGTVKKNVSSTFHFRSHYIN